MKIQSSLEQGNTLLMVLLIIALIVAALGSYLKLTSTEHKTMHRSLSWNAALPLAEAGVEEALSHLNQNKTNFAADGWTTNYFKHRSLGKDYFDVHFDGSPGGLVTIFSTGAVHWLDGKYIKRSVRVLGLAPKDFKFPGLVANTIDFGGTFSADSFDSTSPTDSINGSYSKTKRGDKALVATPNLLFDLGGNAKVLGTIAAGPGGNYTSAGSSSVGDLNWNGKGVQPGHFTNNFTTTFPPVVAPFETGEVPGSGNVGGTNYTYVLEGGAYLVTDLSSSLYGATMLVKDHAVIFVTGSTINLSKIVFAAGARLDFYVSAPSISFAPVIVGATAPMFTIFALPSCTSLSLNNGTYIKGLIYAPDTVLSANGHAAIEGAIACKTFDCNGTFDFHYDLSFGKPRVLPPVRILTWAEQ
jgi:hypothetical protein